MRTKILHHILILYCLTNVIKCFLEKGKWTYYITKNEQFVGVSKILYNQSNIRLLVQCNVPGIKIKYSWLLRLSPCGDEYSYVYDKSDLITTYFNNPESKPLQFPYNVIEYQHSTESDFVPCEQSFLPIKDESEYGHQEIVIQTHTTGNQAYTNVKKLQTSSLPKKLSPSLPTLQENNSPFNWPQNDIDRFENKKDGEPDQEITYTVKTENIIPNEPADGDGNFIDGQMPFTATHNISRAKRRTGKTKGQMDDLTSSGLHSVTRSWKDGNYLFILLIEVEDPNGKYEDISDAKRPPLTDLVTVKIDMADPSGHYLSVHDWPLLPFYACMCALYTVLILLWCFWSIYYFRELLRIQYWILAVIFLGFLEKSLFLGEYQMVNVSGTSIYGALVFAEVVSALKRALSRILIIIASIGYGIVKPRLGSTMRNVVCLGLTYFVFASIEGSLRVSKSKANPASIVIFATIPVALLDAIICWWIFSGLVQTLRTLRLRRNLVKLSMYRHFTNMLVFCIIASIAFMLWSLREHKLITCVTKWRQLWLDDAFWHLLFSLILIAIIILWRPSANNQRYAFTPLLDGSDDENGINDYDGDEGEEKEEFLITAARGSIKMRTKSNDEKKNYTQKPTSTEEDLKWIEENIPPSIADTALPNILDSEEEENIKRFELGKMQ